MKNIFKLLFLSLFLFSCNEEDVKHDMADYPKGGFVKFQTEVKTIDYNAGNGALTYTALDANANAASYAIYKITATVGGANLGSVDVTDIVYTSFPAQVSVSLNQLAGYYGLTGTDLAFGDSFKIFARVTTTDGRVFNGEIPPTAPGVVPNGNVTTTDLLNSAFGYNQAMQFGVTVACPSFVGSAMLGMWTWTNDAWDYPLNGDLFQCVQGSSPNEFIFVDFRNDRDVNPNVPSRSYDLKIIVDPATQSVIVPKQENWNSAMYGLTYGIASVQGTGLVFTCSGTLSVNLSHTVAAGGFGTYNLTLQKQ
jgi:hypothetical protein